MLKHDGTADRDRRGAVDITRSRRRSCAAGAALATVLVATVALAACGSQLPPSPHVAVLTPSPTPSPTLALWHAPGSGQLIVEESSIWRVRVSDIDPNGWPFALSHDHIYYAGGKNGSDLMAVDIAASPTPRRIARADQGFQIIDLAASSERVVLLEESRTLKSDPCKAMACIPPFDARLKVRLISPDGESDRVVGSFAYAGSVIYPPFLASSEGRWAISTTQSYKTTPKTTIEVRDDAGRSIWKSQNQARVDSLMLGGSRLAFTATDGETANLSVYVADLGEPRPITIGPAKSGAWLSQDGRYLAFDPADGGGECEGFTILDLELSQPAASASCVAAEYARNLHVTTGSRGPALAWQAGDAETGGYELRIAGLHSPLLESTVQVGCAAMANWLSVEGDSYVWATEGWSDAGVTWIEWAGFDLSSAEYRIE